MKVGISCKYYRIYKGNRSNIRKRKKTTYETDAILYKECSHIFFAPSVFVLWIKTCLNQIPHLGGMQGLGKWRKDGVGCCFWHDDSSVPWQGGEWPIRVVRGRITWWLHGFTWQSGGCICCNLSMAIQITQVGNKYIEQKPIWIKLKLLCLTLILVTSDTSVSITVEAFLASAFAIYTLCIFITCSTWVS